MARYRRVAMNAMRVAGAAALVAGLLGPRDSVALGARIGLAAILLGLVFTLPGGLLAMMEGSPRADTAPDPALEGLAGMVQSLAFSYAMVLFWMDLSISHSLRLLVGNLVEVRRVQVGAFLEQFAWTVAIGGVGLYGLGWALGESGRSRQSIPRMGCALLLGIAYLLHTRGIAAQFAAGAHYWVEGLVLFPALALPLIQLYAGTDKFSRDREAERTPGVRTALAFGPLTTAMVALTASAELGGATDRLSLTLLRAGPVIAPLFIGWAQRRIGPSLGGHPVMEPALYRGLWVCGILAAVLPIFV